MAMAKVTAAAVAIAVAKLVMAGVAVPGAVVVTRSHHVYR